MMAKHKPPTHLTASAKKLWRSIADEITMDAGAAIMLNLLAESYDRHEQARAEIVKSGAVYMDRFNQPKTSPWAAIERDSALMLGRAYHSLGLDLIPPASEL